MRPFWLHPSPLLCVCVQHSPLLYNCPHPPPQFFVFQFLLLLSLFEVWRETVGVDGMMWLQIDALWAWKAAKCAACSFKIACWFISIIVFEESYGCFVLPRPQTRGQIKSKAGEVAAAAAAAAATNDLHHGAALRTCERWISTQSLFQHSNRRWHNLIGKESSPSN